MEVFMAQTGRPDYQTGFGERVSYGLYFVGQLIFYMLVLSFLVPFFTDIGIPAITVAAIALIVKVWDAVNDPLFGGLVDKVRFKKGKFIPWLKISVFAIPLSTIFLFAAPVSISLTGKIIWVAVGYILWDTAYTICDVPIFGLVTTMTNNQGERNFLMAFTRITSSIGGMAVLILLPLIRQSVGGWLPVSVILSVAGALVMLPVLIKARERHVNLVPAEGFGIREMFKYLGKNKYLLIYYSAIVLAGAGGIGSALGMYIARYNLGNEGMMAMISLLGFVPSLGVALLIPFIIKRADKFTLFFWSLIASTALGVVAYFVGYRNVPAFLTMTVIKSIAGGFVMCFTNMFTPDMAEYGYYKTGIPASGITFSVQTFAAKLSAALATAFGALVLSLIGFVEGEGAVQGAGFPDRLWFVSCIVPVLFTCAAIPLLSRYKLRDKYVAIMSKYNNGEITKEEAENGLEGKFK
jgi:sugar (glycoside-pentoside-hexuronide) transporter